jgi:hypothetical protein
MDDLPRYESRCDRIGQAAARIDDAMTDACQGREVLTEAKHGLALKDVRVQDVASCP